MKKLILFLAALLIAPFSFAQYSGLAAINDIIRSTPGITTVAVGTGVQVSAAESVAVKTVSGLVIPVATSATATIPTSAIAVAARTGLRLAGGLGLAFTGYEIYKAAVDSGLHTCPPPDFFCKGDHPNQNLIYRWSSWSYGAIYGTDPAAVCNQRLISYPYWGSTGGVLGAAGTVQGNPSYQCITVGGTKPGTYVDDIVRASSGGTCPTGYTASGGTCVYSGTETYSTPMTDTDFESSFMNSLSANSVRNKIVYDALRNDMQAGRYKVPENVMAPPTAPVTVTAPPVTTPETVIKTDTVPKADGSTDTVTTKSKTTVTPTPSGTTIGDISISYPTTTTITTTTTNNVTNNTTTQQTTVNETPTPDKVDDPCKSNPGRVGCVDLGTPPSAETIPSQNIDATYSPVAFASNASCPAPLTYDLGRFGGSRSISFQPFCDWAQGVRGLFLALAGIACAWIFANGVSKL